MKPFILWSVVVFVLYTACVWIIGYCDGYEKGLEMGASDKKVDD